ncbi:MAG: hypothetical protein V1809_08890 [Planctomycetota bacterium]
MTAPANTTSQWTETEMTLGRTFARFAIMPTRLQEILNHVSAEAPLLRQISSKNDEIRQDTTFIRETLNKIAGCDGGDAKIEAGIAAIAKDIRGIQEWRTCLETLGERLQTYQEQVSDPLARRVMGMIYTYEDVLANQPASGNGDMADLLTSVIRELTELLAEYGIEPVAHKPGVPFDPKEMKPVGFCLPQTPEEANTIALSKHTGFRRGRQVLRYQEVMIFRS